MPKFFVKALRSYECTELWEGEVEADTEKEAFMLVEGGERELAFVKSYDGACDDGFTVEECERIE